MIAVLLTLLYRWAVSYRERAVRTPAIDRFRFSCSYHECLVDAWLLTDMKRLAIWCGRYAVLAAPMIVRAASYSIRIESISMCCMSLSCPLLTTVC